MRKFCLTLAACLIAAVANAQSGEPPNAKDLPAKDVPAKETPAKEKAPETRAERLDWLFTQLKAAPDENAAQRFATQIGAIFLESGSDTVDLLMSRALRSIKDKDYALALDLLDQVVTLKPDYAEGWNKRATVHFLQDNYGPAISDIEHVLALEPRHFGALSGLGMILGEIDDKKRATQVFELVLSIYPQLENAKKALKELEKERRERDI